MIARRALALFVCSLFLGQSASAHRLDEYLQATLVSLEADHLHASMRLIPGISVAPAIVAAIDTNGDGILSATEQRTYAGRVLANLVITVDGSSVQPQLLTCDFPKPAEMQQGLGEIHIEYSAELPYATERRGSSGFHSLVISNRLWSAGSVYLFNAEVPTDPSLHFVSQKRNAQQSIYELNYQQSGSLTSSSASSRLRLWFGKIQFPGLFQLGMRHIAEGADHLLFLLALLLPAPLLVFGGRWAGPAPLRPSLLRVFTIVTAFTIGHSITLTLAAMGAVHVASRLVEVLIAVSILVSALHALRPILPGKEWFIAIFFGLIHGLAFAATLDRLGMGRWERLGGILAFNLGIETMQMIVVAAVLPSLMLLSRTRAYLPFRVGGALFAAVASLAWIVQRLTEVQTPIDGIVSTFARYAVWMAVALFAVSLVCRSLPAMAFDPDVRRR